MASHFRLLIGQILVWLEISLFVTSSMAVDYSDGFGQRSSKRFCGKMITDSLALICDGEYETIVPMEKRSDESFDEYNDQPAALNLPAKYQSYPYLAKIAPDTAAVRSRVRRDWISRRGVYDECCRKPCSVQELRSYCKRKN